MPSVIKGDSNVNLDFSTGGRITGDFSNATLANRVYFQNSVTNAGTSVGVIPNGTGANSAYNAFANSDPTNTSYGQFRVGTDTGDVRITSGISGSGSYLPMTFYTGGSERMRVDTSGNVGIGASSTNRLSLTYDGGTGAATIGPNSTGGSTYLTLGTSNAGTYAERARIDSSGNVGIGTSSPSYKLDVSGSAAGQPLVRVQNSASHEATIRYTTAHSSSSDYKVGASITVANAFEIYSVAAGASRAIIDSSGNLLVGTTSPGSGSSTGLTIASGKYLWNVGAYNFTTATGANLVVQSDGIFQRSSSALKYKQDIRDIEAVDISNFRPVRYKSNCQGDDQTKDYFGIVADEVADAGFEELVTRGADGEVEGFQYDRFTVVLLKAIQEQQAIITALTARVTALEGQP